MKEIEGFSNYKITIDGSIYSGNKQLKSRIDKHGYLRIALTKDKKQFHRLVHRLLALTYISNPENKPTVNHKDGNKLNNHISNLEWATISENTSHAHKLRLIDQRGERNPGSRLTNDQSIIIRYLKSVGFKLKEISNLLGTNYYTTRHCFYNKTFLNTIGETKMQGDNKVKQFLQDNPDYTEQLKQEVLTKLKTI